MKISVVRMLLFLVVISLYSCAADDNEVTVRLFQPDAIRQALAYDPGSLSVAITVNGGSVQTFSVDGGSVDPVVSITGIRINEQNEITIRWIERVDGRDVAISLQQQTFMADGNTVIDAQHQYSAYDYDNDSVSNFQERLAGTCVWSSNEICNATDNTEPGGNLLSNGDFSDTTTSWFARGDDQYGQQGEYCVTSLATAVEDYQSYFGHSPMLSLRGNIDYILSFDIKADRNASVFATLNNQNNGFIRLLKEEVSVSTGYERKTVPFSLSGDWPNVVLTISMGAHPTVRFCIDNVSLTAAE